MKISVEESSIVIRSANFRFPPPLFGLSVQVFAVIVCIR